jgi:hypothetical protein
MDGPSPLNRGLGSAKVKSEHPKQSSRTKGRWVSNGVRWSNLLHLSDLSIRKVDRATSCAASVSFQMVAETMWTVEFDLDGER